MHGDVWGLVLSVLLIGFFLGVSFLIVKFGKKRLGNSCSEVARKVVHIGVSNWFFIYCYVFETDIWPIAGLAVFTVMNAVMNISGGLKTVMGQEDKKRNWGLVQYPVSIIILIVLKMLGVGDDVALGCAVLGMGYGDGLASIVGRALKSRRISERNPKTIAGCLTMFAVTCIIVFVLRIAMGGAEALPSLLLALGTAAAATAVEAFTPFGLDNITVPVVIYLIVGLL